MKIGITCYPTYGGSGILATELGKILARKGHEVHFITSSLPYRLQMRYEERIYFHEVEMHHYPLLEHSPYDLALASKMKEIFTAYGLDLLHVHYALPHAVSAFLASRMVSPRRFPVVTTLHGTDITVVGQEKSYYDITRLGMNESTVVTSVSQYLTGEAERIFKPEKKIRTVYNFVDIDLFKRTTGECDRQLFASPQQVIYAHISNFRKVKRIPDVIKIFHRVQQEINSVLLLIGEGPTLSQAREQVRELGIQERVRFMGKQEDIVTIFCIADVFLFPSEEESFGLAALEAMACEVPVIASRSGGIPEVVIDGEGGFLSEVGDIDRMAAMSIKLGKSAQLRETMGRAGRERARQYFSPEIIIPQYEAVYKEAVDVYRDS
jgi:N-acetyl-alpha-D-glucosaminyl L-malate synthase BshA